MIHRVVRRGGLTALAVAVFILVGTIGFGPGGQAATAEAAWEALEDGGYIALVRRTDAIDGDDLPVADPTNCAERSMLTEEGAIQARRIGDAFRARDITVDAVYTSQWCSAAETASHLDLGPVKPFPALNSFAGQTDRKDAQMAALRPWVANSSPEGNLILVTHRGVATALTDLVPSAGEIIVLKPLGSGKIVVVGRIEPL